MSNEVEMKLALGPLGPDNLRRHPILAGVPSHRRTLLNTYFDTPEGDLQRMRVALRLRHSGDAWVQTLKTGGQGGGGLSVRGEWEWPVPGPQLDLEGLARLPAIQALDQRLLAKVQERFTTDFERDTWDIEYQGSQIEIALDQGEITAAGHKVRIREAELELKAGDSATLLALADELAARVPLRPSDTSKAARGSALLSGSWKLPEASAPAQWLHRATVAMDAYSDTRESDWLIQAATALERLAETAPKAGHIALHLRTHRLSSDDEDDWLNPDIGAALLTLSRQLPDSTEMT
uniref:CYTH domain-containing protein n=1 Tax=Halomonas sp. TaxID=1486246 RepID=UPI002636B97E|nr:CYTH domain-containing protein [Halomonas sp.]